MIEIKRLELEIMRVRTAKAELEFKKLEMEDSLKRIDDHINIQVAKEAELDAKVSQLKKGS